MEPCATSQEATRAPPHIPPRSLAKLVATWDAAREKDLLVLSVKEALTTIKHYAGVERWAATERLYDLLSTAGNTRRKSSVMNLKEAVSMGNTTEGEIAKWESLDRRCDALLSEVDEFEGLFPDRYQAYLRGLVAEVAEAPWELGHPHDSPWDHVKSIFMDAAEVSALASEDVASQHQQGHFSAVEVGEWSTAPTRRPTEHVPSSRKLCVSCVATDNTEPHLSMIVIGTIRGDVISFPVEAMITTMGGTGSGATAQQPGERPSSAGSVFGASTTDREIEIPAQGVNDLPTPAPLSLAQVIQQLLQTRRKALVEKSTSIEFLSPTLNGVRVYQGHQFEVLDLTIISYAGADYESSKLVVSCALDKVVRVSNVSTGALVGLYSDSTSVVPNCQYFPAMNCIIQGNYHGTVEAWDFRTSTLITPLLELEQPVTYVHLSPSTLTSSSSSSSSKQPAGGAKSPTMFVGTRKGHIYKVRINMVEVEGSDRRRINSHNPVMYECGFLGDPLAPLPPELSPVQKEPIVTTAEQQLVPKEGVSVSAASSVTNSSSVKPATQPQHAAGEVTLQIQGSAGYSSSLLTGASPPPLPTLVTGGHTYAIAKITTLGPFLFSADTSGKVVQWDQERRTYVRKFQSHTDTITSLIVTADGFLLTASRDGLTCVWSVTSGHMIKKLNRHFNVVSGLVIGLAPQQQPSAVPRGTVKPRNLSVAEPLAATTLSATPATASLSGVSPTAAAAKKNLKTGTTGAGGAAAPSTSSSHSLKGKSQKTQKRAGDAMTKSFPEVPLAYRKVQCGAGELVTLDTASCSASAKVMMISFAMDESAILWEVGAERPDFGSTLRTL
jgi:WD40 repeat protein